MVRFSWSLRFLFNAEIWSVSSQRLVIFYVLSRNYLSEKLFGLQDISSLIRHLMKIKKLLLIIIWNKYLQIIHINFQIFIYLFELIIQQLPWVWSSMNQMYLFIQILHRLNYPKPLNNIKMANSKQIWNYPIDRSLRLVHTILVISIYKNNFDKFFWWISRK